MVDEWGSLLNLPTSTVGRACADGRGGLLTSSVDWAERGRACETAYDLASVEPRLLWSSLRTFAEISQKVVGKAGPERRLGQVPRRCELQASHRSWPFLAQRPAVRAVCHIGS